jgi:formylglycine-generating enzyme required for sulfatase activity
MFEYDVFLSYSSKDKIIVHALAERLKQNGLRVWLDKWEIKPGNLIPLKIQEGLEKSHTLLMCMSPAYFESEWGRMEHLTILFRNPTNTQRRLIPLLITDCTPPDTIAQFAYIDWRTRSDEACGDILDSCSENNSEFSLTNLVKQKHREEERRREEKEILKKVKLKSEEIPKTFISPSNGMEFVLIPAGKFMMGSPSGEKGRYDYEGPAHEVTIKNSFYIGKYPVTQKQWEKVMGSNPSNFKGKDRPVESVSWNDVQEFIKKLNEKESPGKYRLPSESEWEYVCRAGITTRYAFGDDESKLGDHAWYDTNSGFQTHPVGQKKPNSWGLYDMHGNIWELCQDKWHPDYDGAPPDGSAWEGGSSSIRVFRGGSWLNLAGVCRSAYRNRSGPGNRYDYLGFRVLRTL